MGLWRHQQEAVDLALNKGSFAFLMDPGTGKTLTTIECLKFQYNKAKVILPTLIICPLIVIENWADELKRFSKIPHKKILPLYGTSKKREKTFSDMLLKENGNAIVITNYDCLVSAKSFYSLLFNWSPTILVIDESHKIKSQTSQRTKLVIKIAERAYIKYLLTGTPILNSPMDIFTQWRALDSGETFGKNYYTFRAKYFYDKNSTMPRNMYFPNWQIRPDALKEISDKMSLRSYRAVKKDCLDLPPLVEKIIKVELAPNQRKVYDQMKQHFLAYIDEEEKKGVIHADIALTKLLRLLQIVSGFMVTDDDQVITFDNNPRLAATKELLEEIAPNHKIIIWCVFKQNYAQIRKICQSLQLEYVEAHGEVSTNKKFEAVNSFNNNDRVRIFIGHPASLGIGINLVGASYSIRYSRSFNFGDLEQSNARNYRGGSEIHEKITRIDLVAKDTIDEDIVSALEGKSGTLEQILQSIRRQCD
jgi:SNF2 family DNA or RNA helicase